MIANCLVFLLLSFHEFCVQSLESVLVCVFVNLMYRLVYRSRMDQNEEDQDQELTCEGPDLAELPDCYALTDLQKTDRIRDLEHEVEVLNRQLVDTRNQLNTLMTETDRYKRVHGQVGWLLEQFRHTLSGCYDKPKLEAILPPPPTPLPPPPLPLLDLPLPLPTTDYTDDSLTQISTIDLTASETSQFLSVAGGESLEGESEIGESLEGDFEDQENEEGEYSDDWETTEEVTASESSPSVQEQDSTSTEPDLPDLATLLANVNTKTHISEIFRKLTSHEKTTAEN